MRKRHPAKLMLVCLLLGAIVNVLVAWAAVVFNDGRMEERSTVEVGDESLRLWSAIVPADWTRRPDVEFVNTATFGMETLSLVDMDHGSTPNAWFRALSRLKAGWPLRSFASMSLVDPNEDESQIISATKAIEFPFNLGAHRLPYGPMWQGLIANTIFFAAIVWLMIRGPWETRRRWRELRGKCGACGYPAGDSSVCTECGYNLSTAWGSAKR